MTGTFEGIRQRHLNRKGRPVTLKRGDQMVILMAFFSVWRPDDLAPPLRQGDMRIDILADLGDITPPPRDPDMLITLEGTAYTIVFANPIYEASTLIGWTLAGRGA